MYARVEDDEIIETRRLPRDARVSNPEALPIDELNALGWFEVVEVEPTPPSARQQLVRTEVELVDGTPVQVHIYEPIPPPTPVVRSEDRIAALEDLLVAKNVITRAEATGAAETARGRRPQ